MKQKSYKYLDNFKKYVLPLILTLFFWVAYKKICDFFIFRSFFDIVTANLVADIATILLILTTSYFLYKFKVNSIDKSKSMEIYKCIIISILGAIILVVFVRVYFKFLNLSHGVNDNMLKRFDEINFIVNNISASVSAPILEELIFRQFFFGVLYDMHDGCNKYIRFFTAAIISGIVFSLMHKVNIVSLHLFVYLIQSMFFSWIYLYTKNIKSSMLLHGFRNFIPVILYFIKGII